ncbi:lysine transporter LysE [Rhizocola hellebori]|uniref:Lysine transporter LysE n=1 Tax=Rhizocola hellebori TaxID=1392758 RepID=A0A8J3VG52_9ACTN|nr:LysE family transporter [Rhizocola hellebori]GIH05095.1 lysine transporter LysE [Rhizocola hellebori]
MTAALLAGLVAGYGVAIPLGAIGALLMSLGARTPWRIASAAALGPAVADGIYALVAVLGGASLARWIEPISTPLRWIAVAVLLFMAFRTTASAIKHYRDPTKAREVPELTSPGRAFAALLGLTLLNPATILYFGALVLGWQSSGSYDGGEGAVWVAAVVVASASWQLLLAGGGAVVGRVLRSPKGKLGTAIGSSVMIGGLAIYVLLS